MIELDVAGSLDTIFQDVTLTVGQSYTLAYSYVGRIGENSTSNTIEVYVGGTLQQTVVASNTSIGQAEPSALRLAQRQHVSSFEKLLEETIAWVRCWTIFN